MTQTVLDVDGNEVSVRSFVEDQGGRTLHDFGGRFTLSSSQLQRLSRLRGRIELFRANGGSLDVSVTGCGTMTVIAFGRDARDGTFAYVALVAAGLVPPLQG